MPSHHSTAPASKNSASAPATSQPNRFEELRAAGATAGRRDEDALSAIHFNCSLTSCAVCNRSSGSFARQLLTVASSASGDKGCTVEIAGGSAARIAAMVDAAG